jgi:hypothetical protein
VYLCCVGTGIVGNFVANNAVNETGAIDILSLFLSVDFYFSYVNSPMLYLYKNGPAIGGGSCKSVEWRHHLPCFRPLAPDGVYWLSLVEK